MIRELLLRRKIFEAESEVDKFLADNEIDLQSNTVIQTLIFDKSVFENEAEAREWASDHGFHASKVDETDSSFRLRQLNPSQFKDDSFRTIEIRRGIKAVIGVLDDEPAMASEVYFSEKGEIGFGHKLESIDLHEGLPHIIEIARVAEGEHPSYGKLKITQENLQAMEQNFRSKVTGVDLAVNEDHRKNEAFGWFKDVFLSYDKQTLYGQVQWNTKGIQALSEKEYRYFSPEFRFNYVHPHTGKEYGATLLGGALTNYPFLKMEAITELNEKKHGEQKMKDTTIELSVHNDKVVELSNKINEVQLKLDAKLAENVELSTKVNELEAQIENNKKQVAHKKLFDEGKINKAQLVALNEGKSFLEVLALNEKMNVDSKGTSETPKEEIKLSEKEMQFAKSLGLTSEEFVTLNK